MKETSQNAAITGALAALAASSCCIPPVIALIAGFGGASSNLSWMEPLRPYLIGIAILAIGYAWYNYFKPKQDDDCGCEIESPKFYQKKGFLIGITIFAAISIAFPYYSHIFYPNNQAKVIVVDQSNIHETTVEIEGMTCESCEHHVTHAINELAGIITVQPSYNNGNAIVKFDETKTSLDSIVNAINQTGYTVVNNK